MSFAEHLISPSRAYLGLGGNIGDVVAHMGTALQRLDANAEIEVIRVSPVYRSPPWGYEQQDWFHNCCAAVETTLSARSLLAQCLEQEVYSGRERRRRWGPRTLDIDLLIFGEEAWSDDQLTLPHPRIVERAFVLKPLSDISPESLIDGKTADHWLTKLDNWELERLDLAIDWWKTS